MIVDGELAGKAAAFTAAFLWAITVTVLTFAARRIGPQVVNAARLVLAAMLLLLLHWIFAGTPWPAGMGRSGTAWLLLSGVLGFAMADGLGLESFVEIGPHLGMLMQTLAPVLSATLAWTFMGQNLSWTKGSAVLATLSAIAQAPLGIVSTLLALVPIFLLPLSWIFFHEPITPRAVAGTLLTVGGAAGLFLAP